MLRTDGFLSSALPTFPSWNVFTDRPVVSSLAASRPLQFFFSLRRLIHISTSFSTWGLAKLKMKSKLSRSFWRVFTSTYALSFLEECSLCLTFLSSLEPILLKRGAQFFYSMLSLWPFFSPRCRYFAYSTIYPISHNLVIWADGLVIFPFGKKVLAFLPIAHFMALRPSFCLTGLVCSCFSAEACAIL